MAGITLEANGIDPIRSQLQQLVQRGSNLEPVLNNIGEQLLLIHDQRFRDQTTPSGEPWQTYSANYNKPKNQSLILQLNMHLSGELAYQTSNDNLEFGTNLEYGAIHQYGGTPEMRAQTAAIPQREWLGVSSSDIEAISEMVAEFLQQACRSV